MVKNLRAMQETQVWSPGKIPWTRKWQPTPASLPGESHGQRSLAGCSPWGHRVGLNLDSTTTRMVPSVSLVESVDVEIWLLGRGLFSHPVMSDSLQPHEPQHARPPCPSPAPRVYQNSCPLSRWCHPTISSSVVPFSSCPQSFPASGSFPMSQFFASGGQSIGLSASASVLPMNTQDWSPLGWTGWSSLQSKGLSRIFSNTTVQSINCWVLSLLYGASLTSIYESGKKHTLTRETFVGKLMSLLFNMLSKFVIAFLARSKRLLISWLRSPSWQRVGAPNSPMLFKGPLSGD